jgi:hypothetical protein
VFLLIGRRDQIGFVSQYGAVVILDLFPLLSLFQPYPRASAILVDELYVCRLECPTNRLESRAARLACTCFELMHGHYTHLSVFSEFLLAPFQEAARCPAL